MCIRDRGTAAPTVSTAATGPGPIPEATAEAPAPASASCDSFPSPTSCPQLSPEGLAAGLSTSSGNIRCLKHRSQGAPLLHATPAPCSGPRSPEGPRAQGDGGQLGAKRLTPLGRAEVSPGRLAQTQPCALNAPRLDTASPHTPWCPHREHRPRLSQHPNQTAAGTHVNFTHARCWL